MLPYAAKLQKVEGMLEILAALGGQKAPLFVDLGNPESDVTVSFFPPDEAKLGAFHYAKERFGRLEKEAGGHMFGSKDGVHLRLFSLCECRVVRTETKEEPVMVPSGETRTVEVPVYECVSPLAAASKAADEIPF